MLQEAAKTKLTKIYQANEMPPFCLADVMCITIYLVVKMLS